ncbi:20000_t:CDS:2 [Dentiscutata erythropus]|uniref:20000_t:CDS:1 n=1 Tax=Dentiscutata erythropus TaxID=1348616 RepID=A0A9N9C593_9GLOM|nr:20000_t:CDS:2 [Dentiscutata erythropus]
MLGERKRTAEKEKGMVWEYQGRVNDREGKCHEKVVLEKNKCWGKASIRKINIGKSKCHKSKYWGK